MKEMKAMIKERSATVLGKKPIVESDGQEIGASNIHVSSSSKG